MKIKALVLALLATAGAAQAASSVTLYGQVDVGYEKVQGVSLTQNTYGGGDTNSRLGLKGQEDLGNGLAATFQLEGSFASDTGATNGNSFFSRESTVGLKGNFGHIRLGRSASAMERASADFQVGERIADWNPYTSAERYSNALFYDYNYGGFNFGGNVSTKGGYAGNTSEGVSDSKMSYGVFAGYKSAGLNLSAAYQRDNGTPKSEWFAGASYTWKALTLGGSYARASHDSRYLFTASNACVAQQMLNPTAGISCTAQYQPVSVNADVDTTTWQAFAKAALTSRDDIYLKYMSQKSKMNGSTTITPIMGTITPTSGSSFSAESKASIWALGYQHRLSKRTSIYADVARIKANDDSSMAWDIALRHKF